MGADPRKLVELSRADLLQSALVQFNGTHCPVCGVEWTEKEFRDHLAKEMTAVQAAERERADLVKLLTPARTALSNLAANLRTLKGHAAALEQQEPAKNLEASARLLIDRVTALEKPLPIGEFISAIETPLADEAIAELLRAVSLAVGSVPEPTTTETARDFLVVGQERLEVYRRAGQDLKAAKERATVAHRVVEVYSKSITSELEAIYDEVQANFAELYRSINNDDESSFDAKLIPSLGKLGFDVDFYGRGFFPPGAYHSEGHQDGMGLCLYLALMRYVLGDEFRIAVLDDVLMSIDSGHRRQVCRMLKQQFPATQFILTTHDPIWLKHMKSEGLISAANSIEFRSWSVETGPVDWTVSDVWLEIDAELERNDVPKAAGLLRRFLEYWAQEQCHRLRAPVEFRGDAQFTLGDVLPNAIGTFRRLLKKGKAAAQSWSQPEKTGEITEVEQKFDTAVAATQVDQWQMNATVHYNQWASMQKSDFAPLVSSFKTLVQLSKCEVCETSYFVSPERGAAQAFRCTCGRLHINLLAK